MADLLTFIGNLCSQPDTLCFEVVICYRCSKTYKCAISSCPVKAYKRSYRTLCHAITAITSCLTSLCHQQQLLQLSAALPGAYEQQTGLARVSWHSHATLHGVQEGPSTWIITPRKPPGCAPGSKGTPRRRPPHPLHLDRHSRHVALTHSVYTLQLRRLSLGHVLGCIGHLYVLLFRCALCYITCT